MELRPKCQLSHLPKTGGEREPYSRRRTALGCVIMTSSSPKLTCLPLPPRPTTKNLKSPLLSSLGPAPPMHSELPQYFHIKFMPTKMCSVERHIKRHLKNEITYKTLWSFSNHFFDRSIMVRKTPSIKPKINCDEVLI